MSEADVVEVPRALLTRLLDRVDDLEAELTQYRSENERDKATIRQDVHEAIEKAEAAPALKSTRQTRAPRKTIRQHQWSGCLPSANRASWPTSPPLCDGRKSSPNTSASGPRRRRRNSSSETISRVCCRPPPANASRGSRCIALAGPWRSSPRGWSRSSGRRGMGGY